MEWPISYEDIKKELEILKSGFIPFVDLSRSVVTVSEMNESQGTVTMTATINDPDTIATLDKYRNTTNHISIKYISEVAEHRTEVAAVLDSENTVGESLGFIWLTGTGDSETRLQKIADGSYQLTVTISVG